MQSAGGSRGCAADVRSPCGVTQLEEGVARDADQIGDFCLHLARHVRAWLALEIDQYAHTVWTARNSGLKGYPRAIAQTRDGYLWLATEFGVLRFDGVRFVPGPATATSPLAHDVFTLLATRDGALWIETTRGLWRWKDRTLTPVDELAGHYVSAIAEDSDGAVWAGTSAGLSGSAKLCTIRANGLTCYGESGALGRFVIALHADRRGNLWAGTATGFWHWRPGTSAVFPLPRSASEIHSIVEDADGTLVLALNREPRRANAGRLGGSVLPGIEGLKPTTLLLDRDGALWVGTQDRGLLHVSGGRIDRFTASDGLSGDFVTDIFEDHEGNVWVATLNGLDRFRRFAVATISRKQGLAASGVVSVLATPDGAVWLGTVGGLNRWKDGEIETIPTSAIGAEDGVASLLRDETGRLWISSPRGLASLRGDRLTSSFKCVMDA